VFIMWCGVVGWGGGDTVTLIMQITLQLFTKTNHFRYVFGNVQEVSSAGSP